MRVPYSLVGLSFSVGLCASAHAQTGSAATPPSPATAPASAAPANAYEEQAIGVRNLGSANREMAQSGERPEWVYADRKWDAFRGPDHHPINQEAFYRIVGRQDLLFRYQNQAAIKTAVTVSSGALTLGGLIFAAIAALPKGNAVYASAYSPCPSPGCPPSDHSSVSPSWGLAIAGAGLVGLIVGHYLNPTPINAGEADALARDYDQSLKSQLGISETAKRD
jgi:hypothetical protein